jgi:tetratricopeptide (TPR) repeat protein
MGDFNHLEAIARVPVTTPADIRDQKKELLRRISSASYDSSNEVVQAVADYVDLHEREQLTAPITNWEEFELRLKQLRDAYNEARFEKTTAQSARNLYAFLQTHSDERSEDWSTLTMLYELNDIFHFSGDLNKTVLQQAKQLYAELREVPNTWARMKLIPDEERSLVREKVLYCACGANEMKRAGETQQATKIFEWLLNFTKDSVKTTLNPCLATRATLNYQLGSLYRVLERHQQAEAKFTETLSLLRRKSKEFGPNSNEQLGLLRKKAMVIGIGYGWTNYTRGFLQRAENALITARSLLACSSDPVIPWYIELLYGTILRCRAGTRTDELARAISSLSDARDAFQKVGHARYFARSAWELALAFNLADRYRDAQDHLDIVATYAKVTGHPKWQTNVRILQSRLFRRQGDHENALHEAQAALTIARDYEAALQIIDGYLVRGEAKLAQAEADVQKDKNLSGAKSDFERARAVLAELGARHHDSTLPSNPKIVAVCQLRIAQCYARSGDERRAREHLAHWQILGPNVEHEWVRELAEEVGEEIKELSLNFTISAGDPNAWDYSKSVANLRQWLLKRALTETGKNYSAAAKLLGVKRATLYQWQEAKTKRARTTN